MSNALIVAAPSGVTHVGYGRVNSGRSEIRPTITHCGRAVTSAWTVASPEVQREGYPSCRGCLYAAVAAPHLRHPSRPRTQVLTDPERKQLRGEMKAQIVHRFEGYGQAWWTDNSGDVLAGVAADGALGVLIERGMA